MKTIGIVGGAGIAAGELLRLLQFHEKTKVVSVSSQSQNGKSIDQVHSDLYTFSDLRFVQECDVNVDILFLCGGHGASRSFIEHHQISEKTLIIDLSHDFRLDKDWVYGLPEKNAHLYGTQIGNPGCFATAIQLALLPLAEAKMLSTAVHINAITGATGAGVALQESTQFIKRDNNVSVYKVFGHQHEAEILNTLESAQGEKIDINFVPVRGPFSRGIFASIYFESNITEPELTTIFQERYADAIFTHVMGSTIDLKQVVNTNNALIHVEKIDGKVFITSAIDNLLKGAAGQAVQNMNLAMQWPESTGLNLKSSMF